ncbi:MAG: tRNA (adenosine(37)-N6)-threonylcarbamoyltransferase complex transferase subunit TsaD [Patescibacteria group bacterium]
MKILAIETSCDDTSVAVVENGNHVLSSIVSSQIDLHSKYGGVVPEVAARAHIQNIIPALEEALDEAKTKITNINFIAVTKGPGLIGSLIVGVNTARVIALLNKKPLVSLHHTEGHIYANWLEKSGKNCPKFPLICLTVSGGHTNIIYMRKHLDYHIIGKTLDDSAGEAFDKVAKMLGLGYPGGPIISSCAMTGNEKAYHFPRVDLTQKPIRNNDGFMEESVESLDFSFSGLKTAVLREVRILEATNSLSKNKINDIAASFQVCANDILVRNTIRAARNYGIKTVLLSGGVAANEQLREMLAAAISKLDNVDFYFPASKFCTDNAAMIGAAAYQRILINDFSDPLKLIPDSGLKLIYAS